MILGVDVYSTGWPLMINVTPSRTSCEIRLSLGGGVVKGDLHDCRTSKRGWCTDMSNDSDGGVLHVAFNT